MSHLKTYRVSIKSFPDYKHLLHENYVEYEHILFYHYLTHNSGRVTQICVFNTVKLGTSASSP